jgi:VWFA-related protein
MRTRAAVAVALMVATHAILQAGRPQRFRTQSALVTIDALVTDGRRVITGLGAGDFEVLDNNVPQSVEQVYVEQLPLTVIMVLDTSGSVAGERLDFLKKGALAIVDRLRPADRVAVVSFSHRFDLPSGFTADRAWVRTAIASLRAGGSTSLLDAAFAGLAFRGASSTRTLMVLFSDGVDTGSILDDERVLRVAARSDTTVYAIGVRESPRFVPGAGVRTYGQPRQPEPATDDRFLGRIARDTGGRLLHAQQNRDIETTFARVIEEFNSRYVLGYSPAGTMAPGWHQVTVRLRTRQGTVLARRGYFAK